MSKKVTHVRKDSDGDIIRAKGSTWEEATSTVVNNINAGSDYYVQEVSPKADVHVYQEKHIRTNADSSSKNNLDNLPTF